MLLSAIAFSLYSVLSKSMIKKAGAVTTTSLSFILGSLALLIPIVIMHKPIVAGISQNIPILLYVGICVTGLGYLFYFMAIKGSDASTGSIVFFLKPAIAPVVAVIVLHEVLLWNSFLGIALMLIASYVNLRESRKNAEALSSAPQDELKKGKECTQNE
jgi:drug/metabolite transporter (DMT)-like permease